MVITFVLTLGIILGFCGVRVHDTFVFNRMRRNMPAAREEQVEMHTIARQGLKLLHQNVVNQK